MKCIIFFIGIPVALTILGVHYLGSENALETGIPNDIHSNGAALPSLYTPPAFVPNSDVLPDPVEKLPSVSELPKSEDKPPQPPVRSIDLITCHTETSSTRQVQFYSLTCQGGPADGRKHLAPVIPDELVGIGCLAIWVPSFAPYAPLTEGKIQDKFSFMAYTQDKRKMEIEGIALYVLEEQNGVYHLACEGTVDVVSYAKYLEELPAENPKEQKDSGPTTQVISVKTDTGASRKHAVYPLRCVGGPANGKAYPLPIQPGKLYRAGLGLIGASDVLPRPPDKIKPLSGGLVLNPYVGHMALYALEKTGSNSFQLHFIATADPSEYLAKHRPK